MGLFRALIVIVLGLVMSSMIENPKSKINNLPILGKLLNKKVKKNKCTLIIFTIALIDFIL